MATKLAFADLWLVVVLTTCVLAACVPPIITKPAPPDFCTTARAIRVDVKHDLLTPATNDAILAHNQVGEKLCGWKPTK